MNVKGCFWNGYSSSSVMLPSSITISLPERTPLTSQSTPKDNHEGKEKTIGSFAAMVSEDCEALEAEKSYQDVVSTSIGMLNALDRIARVQSISQDPMSCLASLSIVIQRRLNLADY